MLPFVLMFAAAAMILVMGHMKKDNDWKYPLAFVVGLLIASFFLFLPSPSLDRDGDLEIQRIEIDRKIEEGLKEIAEHEKARGVKREPPPVSLKKKP